MAAKDIYHTAVRRALEKDGWVVTHDPLVLAIGKTEFLIDLGAERLLAAERAGERIAVEVKSFMKPSPVQDLKEAAGQFLLYEAALVESVADSDRVLFLAIREETYDDVFEEAVGQLLLRHSNVKLLVFDPVGEVITQWKK
jgi:hypothetical protein